MKRRWTVVTTLFGAWFVVLALGLPAAAQIRYVDDQGLAHWVQSPTQVPEKYKAKSSTPTLPNVDLGAGADRVQQTRNREFLSQEVWASAVQKCTSSNTDPSFQAYVSSPGRVEMLGSTQARFEFKRCMTDIGQPLR